MHIFEWAVRPLSGEAPKQGKIRAKEVTPRAIGRVVARLREANRTREKSNAKPATCLVEVLENASEASENIGIGPILTLRGASA